MSSGRRRRWLLLTSAIAAAPAERGPFRNNENCAAAIYARCGRSMRSEAPPTERNRVDGTATGNASDSTLRKLRPSQGHPPAQHQPVVPHVSLGLAQAGPAMLTISTERPRHCVGPPPTAATRESPGHDGSERAAGTSRRHRCRPVTFFVARSCCRMRVCWPAGPGMIAAPSRQ